MKQGLEDGWRELGEDVFTGMAEWRHQHPQATLREIEQALDERLSRLRARMLEDAALASKARAWQGAEGPRCPECGERLRPRGEGERHLQTHGGKEVKLRRQYGQCPRCESGLFPPG